LSPDRFLQSVGDLIIGAARYIWAPIWRAFKDGATATVVFFNGAYATPAGFEDCVCKKRIHG
jgi:hypothetical protein